MKMKRVLNDLDLALRKIHYGPTVTIKNIAGTTKLRYHVDNNDDRYVEASDSVHSNDLLLVRRDEKGVAIVVLSNVSEAFRWVVKEIGDLAKVINGRRVEAREPDPEFPCECWEGINDREAMKPCEHERLPTGGGPFHNSSAPGPCRCGADGPPWKHTETCQYD